LKEQVERLREKGSVSVMDAIHAARKRGESVSSTLFFMYQPLPRRGGREGNETVETPEGNSGGPRG
jgi:hypothetical protein